MIADLKPYPEYKESGLQWLGRVPAHWEVERAKSIFQSIDLRSKTGNEELLTVSSARGVVPRNTATVTMFKAESYLGYKLCWPDDLVINSLWAWGGGLGVSSHHGIINSAYGVYRIRPTARMTPAFVHQLVRSSPFNWELHVRSKGIWISRLQLTDESFLDTPMHIPPHSEQAAIVRFIDHADRRIRRYIGVKQKLVKLLEEQKHSIIYGAVAHGLDPNVRLKPSGEAWLGSVPLHWSVASLRFRYAQCLGKMVDAKQVTGKHLIPYLRNVDVRWDRINTIDLPLIDIAPHEIERFTVRVGDLLVCEGRHLGRCAFWNGEVETCAFQKALHRLRPLNTDTDVPRFLFFCMCLAYARDAFNMNKVDNTIPHLTGEMLRAHRFAFPPIEEQRAIAAYLDSATEGIESTAVVAKTEIALLREYRTRLIADVVTGKLDVRAAAAGLPDEVDEAGPLVDADAVEEDDESVGGDALDAAPNEAEV